MDSSPACRSAVAWALCKKIGPKLAPIIRSAPRISCRTDGFVAGTVDTGTGVKIGFVVVDIFSFLTLRLPRLS
jgi:hypothetical protein